MTGKDVTKTLLLPPFHGQVLAACLIEGCLNDCFLHLISVAPKMNAKLLQIIDAIMVPYLAAQEHGEIDALPKEISDSARKVASILRGVVALLSPEVSRNREPQSQVSLGWKMYYFFVLYSTDWTHIG